MIVVLSFAVVSHLSHLGFEFSNGLHIFERTSILELRAAFSHTIQFFEFVGATVLKHWAMSLYVAHGDGFRDLKNG